MFCTQGLGAPCIFARTLSAGAEEVCGACVPLHGTLWLCSGHVPRRREASLLLKAALGTPLANSIKVIKGD